MIDKPMSCYLVNERSRERFGVTRLKFISRDPVQGACKLTVITVWDGTSEVSHDGYILGGGWHLEWE